MYENPEECAPRAPCSETEPFGSAGRIDRAGQAVRPVRRENPVEKTVVKIKRAERTFVVYKRVDFC